MKEWSSFGCNGADQIVSCVLHSLDGARHRPLEGSQKTRVMPQGHDQWLYGFRRGVLGGLGVSRRIRRNAKHPRPERGHADAQTHATGVVPRAGVPREPKPQASKQASKQASERARSERACKIPLYNLDSESNLDMRSILNPLKSHNSLFMRPGSCPVWLGPVLSLEPMPFGIVASIDAS